MANRKVNTNEHFAENAMSKPDFIDEIINSIDPEFVPSEYIIMAKVTTYQGEEMILMGDELEEILANDPDIVANIKIMLNVAKIRHDLDMYATELIETAKQKLAK